MRTVNYDLYKGNVKLASTTDFDRALEWKTMKNDHYYKIRLEEIFSEASKEEKEWRKKPRMSRFAQIALTH